MRNVMVAAFAAVLLGIFAVACSSNDNGDTPEPTGTTEAPATDEVADTPATAPDPTRTPVPPTAVLPPTDIPPTDVPITGNCDHESYPDVCIAPYPPDLNCGDIPYRRFTVRPPDPHRFDADYDGIGCESG